MLTAVIPVSDILDSEATAALAAGFAVVRFRFIDNVEIVSDTAASKDDDIDNNSVRDGVFRGFMLTAPRYQKLYRQLLRNYGIKLTTNPAQYELAHYFPNSYPFVKHFSPRAEFVQIVEDVYSSDDEDDNDGEDQDRLAKNRRSLAVQLRDLPLSHAVFATVAAKISEEHKNTNKDKSHDEQQEADGGGPAAAFSSGFVVLKDFVKSAKPHLLKVPVDDPKALADAAVNLVHHRGTAFNRGVVFKELIPIRSTPRTNEWRLWFVKGNLVSQDWNGPDGDAHFVRAMLEVAEGDTTPDGSAVRHAGFSAVVPERLLFEAEKAVRSMPGAPSFVTVDFAQAAADGSWFCLEVGDGGVSGPAVCQDLHRLWRKLYEAFSPRAASFVVNIHSKVARV